MESEISDRDDPDFINGQKKVVITKMMEQDSFQNSSDNGDEMDMDQLCNELGEMNTEDILEKKLYLEA